MQALFRVGEQVGPFEVVFDETHERNGWFVETMRDSGGWQRIMHLRVQDTSYHSVAERDGNLLVPFTVRHPTTEAALSGHYPSWVDVSGSPYDYWRVMCDWWQGDDFTIVEHDVAPHSEVFEEFRWCPEPWCYFRYSNHTVENAHAWHYGILGCTRFRKELIAAVPDAVTSTEERWRDWHYLSNSLGMALREAGYEPHVHGTIDHHRMMDLGGIVEATKALA